MRMRRQRAIQARRGLGRISGAASGYCDRSKPAHRRSHAAIHKALARCWVPIVPPLWVPTGEDQNDACEDEMDALFEFLTAEPATCPTA
jgi:hypothetical protein